MTIEYLSFYSFCGYTHSWSLCFIIFFIHEIIISYPNDKMDKRFFKNWVLHIPHRFRDLLWMVRAWSSIAPIFFFSESAKSNHFLLAHIPCMNEYHDPRRPFKVAITTSTFSTSSHSSTGFLRSSSDVCSSLQIVWSRNQTSSVSLGRTLVVQVDPWLNQKWSSWSWPSSYLVRFWASSPSGTRTSLLM